MPESAPASATPTTTNDLPGCPEGGPLSGTDKPDKLAGKDGDDEIRGLGDKDFIYGGPGNDVIYGGPGDDSPLVGEEGDDVIYGGDGDDEVGPDSGNDVFYGADGNDEIFGREDSQPDKLYCGKGKDIYEADKNDFVSSSCETDLEDLENTTPPDSTLLEDQEGTTPPDSTLTHGGRDVKGMLGSYCFSGKSGGTCVDTSWPLIPSKQKTLTVPPDSEMVFRYGGQDPPKTVEARAYSLMKLQEKIPAMRPDSSLEAQGSGVQRTIPAKLPPGEYVLEVFVTVQQGDPSYYFRIMVE
jgi:hypothetical protein